MTRRRRQQRVKEIVKKAGNRRQFEFGGVSYRFDGKPVLQVVTNDSPPCPEPCPETLAS